MSALTYPTPKNLPKPPTYSQVVVAAGTRIVYVAGQIAVDETGATVGTGDLSAQTTQAMRNLKSALEAAGASFADVAKITTFVVDYTPEKRSVIGQARGAFFEGLTPPASTLLGVSALAAPDWLIEIEAIAVLS